MSRREKRYKNRQLKRIARKTKRLIYDNFNCVASLDSLYRSAKSASKGVTWKASTQKYLINILFRNWKTRQDLLAGKDIRKGFIKFDINERGKVRHIQSVHFDERVVQKSLCMNVLYPTFSKLLIHDNSASQKGKGTHFSLNRVEKHLREFVRKHGAEGYILTLDFKDYFGKINHKVMKEIYQKNFKDENILKLSYDFIDAFGEVGLGLGSETSQINAITFLNDIDQYIKRNFRYYGRYMDDSYIIHDNKEELKNFLEILKEKYTKVGVVLNLKKTRLAKLKRGFTFLKTRFFVTETGKIIRKPCRKSITRERRKLKKQIGLLDRGILTAEEIAISFVSWKGSMVHRNARKTIYNMEKLFKKIFSEKFDIIKENAKLEGENYGRSKNLLCLQ